MRARRSVLAGVLHDSDHALAEGSDAMSWLDQLRGLEEKARKRLSELEPLVAEHRELQQLLERLGLKRDAPPDAAATEPAPADATDLSPAAASSTAAPARKKAASKRSPAAVKTKPRAAKPKPATAKRKPRPSRGG